MEIVASSELHERASSIAVRKARCDSGRSFKATTILENMRATRLYRKEHSVGSPLHDSGSTGTSCHRERDCAGVSSVLAYKEYVIYRSGIDCYHRVVHLPECGALRLDQTRRRIPRDAVVLARNANR